MSLSFFVPGIPAPQGSKRHVGRGIMVESSKALKPWRATIAAAAPRDRMFIGPVLVDLDFYFPRPRSHYGTGRNAAVLNPYAPTWHTQRPDTDKLARAVLDALTQAGVWRDDSQVVEVHAGKWWTGPDQQSPGVAIGISEVGDR